MYILQHYFDAVTTGQKQNSNGTVLSKFFTPSPGITSPKIDTKKISDDLGAAIVEIFKSYERQNGVKFNFTRKQGRPT